MRLLRINIPPHIYGRSFTFDLANSTQNDFCTGAFAVVDRVVYVDSGTSVTDYHNLGKVAITTDGNMMHPSLPIQCKTPLQAIANKLMSPIDFVQCGNKITVILDEFENTYLNGRMVSYQLSVYIKTTKKPKTLCYKH